MGKKVINPEDIILTPYEQGIEDAIERGEYISDPNFEKNKDKHVEMAKKTLERLKRTSVTFRPFEADIHKLKRIARKEGIPYQTKMISIIHQRVEDYTL